MPETITPWQAQKALYRVDEAARELGYSSNDPIYDLLEAGELVGHWHRPGKRGLKITGTSLARFINRYTIAPADFGAVREKGAEQQKGRGDEKIRRVRS